MTKTFLDSSVLLKAWKSKDNESALKIMADPTREFYTSQIVRLEVMPKAVFHKNRAEEQLYQSHFSVTKKKERLSRELGDEAMQIAGKYGLSAADALNVAAALRNGVEEFFTVELPSRPMFRVPGIRFISLRV